MGSSGFEALRQSVIESLEAVSRSTERVYLKMGEDFPALIRELEANFGTGAEGPMAQAPLSATIEQTLQTIQGHDAVSTSAHEESATMLARLEEQLASLGTLGSCIDDIREDSILMELISLNAMVIAVKAGESGRAFSCITAELKQLSNQTMELTDHIAAGEDALGGIFADFKADLQKINTRERNGFADFLAGSREVFQGLSSGAQKLMGGLSDIRNRALEVKAPLVKIVVEMQNQDRIRQSIDHVLLSLQEFKSLDASVSLEEQLDELSFLEILPELSTMVLEEISEQILANRNAFHSALAEAKTLIGRLEDERQAFLSNYLDTQKEGSLEHWFRVGEDKFSGFVSETEHLSHHREAAFRKSAALQKNVGDLVDSLQSFDFILSKFRNIDIASRIQVARQAALASMQDNASEMTELTRKIESDVGKSISITSSFFGTVQELFETYREQFAKRVKLDEGFHSRLKDTIRNLRQAKEFLGRSVQETRVFSRAFTDLFARTLTDMGVLDALLEEVARQKTDLGQIQSEISEQKRLLMEANGVQQWKLGSEKLKSMIDRFTIFTHKKFAAELGNFEVEQAAASGEVTLF